MNFVPPTSQLPAPEEEGSAPKPVRARVSLAMTDAVETTRVVASMSGDEKAAALCDDVAANVQPDSDSISQHCGQIERSAEDMLARLDELVAVLNKLREDSKEQREALTPALEAWASGLARDFAYLDSAEETVEAVKGAVANVEHQLAQLESTEFRRARLADIEKARKGIEGLFQGWGGGAGSVEGGYWTSIGGGDADQKGS